MTDLRDAAEVWREAVYEYGGQSIPGEGEDRAVWIIKLDRAATRTDERAKVVGDIVAWLRANSGFEDCYSELRGQWLSDRIAAGEWKQ